MFSALIWNGVIGVLMVSFILEWCVSFGIWCLQSTKFTHSQEWLCIFRIKFNLASPVKNSMHTSKKFTSTVSGIRDKCQPWRSIKADQNVSFQWCMRVTQKLICKSTTFTINSGWEWYTQCQADEDFMMWHVSLLMPFIVSKSGSFRLYLSGIIFHLSLITQCKCIYLHIWLPAPPRPTPHL